MLLFIYCVFQSQNTGYTEWCRKNAERLMRRHFATVCSRITRFWPELDACYERRRHPSCEHDNSDISLLTGWKLNTTPDSKLTFFHKSFLFSRGRCTSWLRPGAATVSPNLPKSAKWRNVTAIALIRVIQGNQCWCVKPYAISYGDLPPVLHRFRQFVWSNFPCGQGVMHAS